MTQNNNNGTVNGFIPAGFAIQLGMKVRETVGDNGSVRKHGIKLDTPCKILTSAQVEALLAKNPHWKDEVEVSTSNKAGGPPVTMGRFLEELAKISTEQGYLTAKDFAEASSLTIVNENAGSKTFRQMVKKLVAAGYLASVGKGRTAGELHEEDDFSGVGDIL